MEDIISISWTEGRKYFKGVNPLTPKIEGFFAKGRYVIELSSGDVYTPVYPEHVYAVCVINKTEEILTGIKDQISPELSEYGFKSITEAKEYINSL